MNADQKYAELITEVLAGPVIDTRNSPTRRAICRTVEFDSVPLVTTRRTAWRNALREMEWFLSGSNDINNLHPDVRKWWEPFCTASKVNLFHNYGDAFRRVYAPGTGKPVVIEPVVYSDDPVVVPKWGGETPDGSCRPIGHAGRNHHGDNFRVIRKTGVDKYRIQFDSNGFCRDALLVNIKSGTVKNPYYPTVVGGGCYGIPKKADYSYHKKAYRLWSDMMNRCYNPDRRQYKWYKGVYVSGRWKCFEYFLSDLASVPGFAEWLAGGTPYNLDKDYKKTNLYSSNTCVFLPKSMNVGLSNVERHRDAPRRELYVDQIQNLIDGVRDHPYSRRNCVTTWIPQHVQAGLINPTNCHGSWIQVFGTPIVGGGAKIDLWMCQRSCDLILGVPHNWVQYWAFLLWLAHRTGTQPGRFIWTGGDVHVYAEHEQVARGIVAMTTGAGAPQMGYSPTSDKFLAADFAVSGVLSPSITDTVKMIV